MGGGVLFTLEGTRLGYITYRGPGAGFFTVWAGLLIAVAGFLIAIRRPAPLRDAAKIVWNKQFLTIMTAALYVLLILYLGTIVATIIYFILTLLVIERHSLWKVVLCCGTSIAIIYLTFEVWLKIPLSLGIFDAY